MGTIEQRLADLERQFRRAQWGNRVLAFALAVVVCLAGAQIPQAQPPQAQAPHTEAPHTKAPTSKPSAETSADDAPGEVKDRLRTLEANQLVLRDRLGRSRITLEVTDEGPAMSMFDEQGQKRLLLQQSAGASAVRLLDSNGASLASLQVEYAGDRAELEMRSSQGTLLTRASGVSILDTAENVRLQLALINGNFPVLGISQRGQQGPASVEITAGDGGTRGLKMHDGAGHPLFTAAAAENGTTYLNLRHPDHERSLQISTGPKGEDGPQIAFIAPAKRDGSGGVLPYLQFGMRKDQLPYIRIVDDGGKPLFTAPGK